MDQDGYLRLEERNSLSFYDYLRVICDSAQKFAYVLKKGHTVSPEPFVFGHHQNVIKKFI
jgi:hypothetical protein